MCGGSSPPKPPDPKGAPIEPIPELVLDEEGSARRKDRRAKKAARGGRSGLRIRLDPRGGAGVNTGGGGGLKIGI